MKKLTNILPTDYQILPELVPMRIPGFLKHYHSDWKTLSPEEVPCQEWYDEFVKRVMEARGRKFLPVCRMSDGEYLFLLGAQNPSARLPWCSRLHLRLRTYVRRTVFRHINFASATRPGVSSGSYSAAEWHNERPRYKENCAWIAGQGVLALHLSFIRRPTIEQYFKSFGHWLKDHSVTLTLSNYVPFYFVYAMLIGRDCEKLLKGQKVLVLHSSEGQKREKIIQSLNAKGPNQILWKSISKDRSLFDAVVLSEAEMNCDLCLIGGGVGKVNLMRQMEGFRGPVIDAGYLFEVWSDPDAKWNRPFCVTDEEMDFDRISFVSPKERRELKKIHLEDTG